MYSKKINLLTKNYVSYIIGEMNKNERITEIKKQIAEIDTAMSAIRKGGQQYSITSSAGGGTMRSVTMADYEALKIERKELQNELANLEGSGGFRLRAGW
jgi:hypothetical protein